MAHLEVKPKNGTPWWLWLLLALIALAILLLLFKGCGNKPKEVAATDSTTTTTTDTTGKQAVAVTEPDWNSVDFNSPKTSDSNITDKDIQVSGNDKYTIYTLGENILFATDKNEVQPGAESKLKQIVASLNERYKGATIGVFGNADSTGTAGHNKELGAGRASAVQSWLTKNGGIDASRISVHSYGENAPVASNATAEGRKQNRNVQIVAFPNSSGQ
jgi:outer membrane protein OmpA-like peptidoglycan-associated protein